MKDDKVLAQKTEPKLAAKLAELESVWRGLGGAPYAIGALVEAFNLCAYGRAPLPLWLSRAVRAELTSQSKQQITHYQRWREVRKMRDTRPLSIDWSKRLPVGRQV